jgi:sugar transferase (PEP-CTERM/EpsH1 system associated)
MKPPILILHLLYRFECGGMQKIIADCVNGLPAAQFQHVIVCLTDFTDFFKTIKTQNVEIFALKKKNGSSLASHFHLYRLIRKLRPGIIHTYNIGAMEYAVTAAVAGVGLRLHAEHGRGDVEYSGRHWKYNLLRRLVTPFLHGVVTVSRELQTWLSETVRIPPSKIRFVANGVEILPNENPALHSPPDFPVQSDGCFIIGTVGRIDENKRQSQLIDAFADLLGRFPKQRQRLFLIIIGDGPLIETLRKKVEKRKIGDRVWIPGPRDDVKMVMARFSLFVLPSKSEATPLTILEAMSAGLPVVATRVGGVPKIVIEGDARLLADAISPYLFDANLCTRQGDAGRLFVQTHHGVEKMVNAYMALYSELSRLPDFLKHPLPPNQDDTEQSY